MKMELALGTRASALALAQTELVREALTRAHQSLQVEVKTFVTRGDQKLDLSLLRGSEAGGKGLFTKELEDALLFRSIDVAVHSLKDLPGHMPEGLALAAVLPRAETADVLISKHPGGFEGLPAGATVGTSSIRRARQLQWRRRDLATVEWRGNVQTRLRKLGEQAEVSAIVLAAAGLQRLGLLARSSVSGQIHHEGWAFHVTSLAPHLLPAIGQGVIALQTRRGDDETASLLQGINDAQTAVEVVAERELQRLLAGDCTLPVGVRIEIEGQTLRMHGILFGDEPQPIESRVEGDVAVPEAVAARLAALLRGEQA